MAKKKAAPSRGEGAARLRNIFVMSGTDEFKAWLAGFAAHRGLPLTILIEQLLRESAKREKYPPPPPRVP
jgi:hypothetical protein